ncbi:MAG: ATP-binding protein [Acidobacteriota bacterium]
MPDFAAHLTAQSILRELPSHDQTFDVSTKGEVVGALFEAQPGLPGVIVTQRDGLLGVISRRRYLRLVARQFGPEVFHPRPLQVMLDALKIQSAPEIFDPAVPIQAVVQRSLERPAVQLYEPVVRRESPSGDGSPALTLVDFPDLLRADARISALRNAQMKQILATVREGFLLIDRQHRIAAEYSASVAQMLGREDLADRALPDVLAPMIGPEKAELCRDYLGILFDPNAIENLIASINPLREIEARRPQDRAALILAFRFVRGEVDANGDILRVLVRIEDVTRAAAMAAELEAQELRARARVDLVFELVGTAPDDLMRLLDRLDAVLGAADALGQDGEDARPALAALFRQVHAIKGEAGLLGLGTLQRRLHGFEGTLVDLRDGELPLRRASDLAPLRTARDELSGLIDEVRGLVEQFRRLARVAAPAQQPASSQPAPVQQPVAPQAAPVQQPVAPQAAPAQQPVAPQAAPAQEPAASQPAPVQQPASSQPAAAQPAADAAVDDPFRGVAQALETLGQRLGKPARFVTRAAPSDVPDIYRGLVRDALIQFARNAVVHGFELPDVRRGRGKAPVGTLQFAVRHHPKHGSIEFVVQDDGGGLDEDALRARAQDVGLDGRALDTAQLAQLIFRPGVSTATDVTLDAGRGVGLDLVHDAVVSRGGRIRPHTKRGAYCAFQILLPWPIPAEDAS